MASGIFFTDLRQVGYYGLALLIISGFLATTLGRLMRIIAMERLGLVGSTPLVSASPLLAVFLATSVRGETFTVVLALGTTIILLGVALLSEAKWKISRGGVIASLCTALLYGVAENFRKMGVTEVGSPPFGAAIGASMALATYTAYSRTVSRSRKIRRESNIFFVAAGMATSMALLFTFTALSMTDVVVAVPLFSTTPLFTLVFAKIFLGAEKITFRALISTVMTVAGAILIVTR